jgi:hypothetical protein
MQVAYLFAELCCKYDERSIADLIRYFPSAATPALRSLVEEHHVFDALAHVQRQEGALRESRRSLLLRARVALLDLRSFVTGLLPFLECPDGCTGDKGSCAVTCVLKQILGESDSGGGSSLHTAVVEQLQHKVVEGARLRERAHTAIAEVDSALLPDENEVATDDSDLEAGLVELALSLLAEIGVGCSIAGDAEGMEEVDVTGQGLSTEPHAADSGAQDAGMPHPERVMGRSWEAFTTGALDGVLRPRVTRGAGPSEPLLQVLEALDAATKGSIGETAASRGEAAGEGSVWVADAARWRAVCEARGDEATGHQVARCRGAQVTVEAMAQVRVQWRVAVLYAELVLRAQRALRHVRESLMAVMREEYFEVDKEWRQELHTPVLLGHADLAR